MLSSLEFKTCVNSENNMERNEGATKTTLSKQHKNLHLLHLQTVKTVLENENMELLKANDALTAALQEPDGDYDSLERRMMNTKKLHFDLFTTHQTINVETKFIEHRCKVERKLMYRTIWEHEVAEKEYTKKEADANSLLNKLQEDVKREKLDVTQVVAEMKHLQKENEEIEIDIVKLISEMGRISEENKAYFNQWKRYKKLNKMAQADLRKNMDEFF